MDLTCITTLENSFLSAINRGINVCIGHYYVPKPECFLFEGVNFE